MVKKPTPSKTTTESTLHLALSVGSSIPRILTFPARWIPAAGVAVGVLLLITFGSLGLAVRYSVALKKSDSGKIQTLEEELILAREKLAALTVAAADAAKSGSINSNYASNVQDEATAKVPDTLKGAPVAQSTQVDSNHPQLFSAISPKSKDLSHDASSQTISIDTPRLSWRGKTLRVHFNLHYVKDDRGNQQGRIVILARGPDTLISYPENVFSKPGQSPLILFENGEYFSVSRFREVLAEFNIARPTNTVTDIEVLLFDSIGNVLTHQSMPVPQTSSGRQRTPPPKSEVSSDSDATNIPAKEPANDATSGE